MIELSNTVRELHRELTAEVSEGDGERLRFELGPVEIEASVTISKEAEAEAKLRFGPRKLELPGNSHVPTPNASPSRCISS
ncbi:hypothetical protein GCM10012285_23760 [Streptomyces kronopolitis]|uniref:Trypsin-co-occurring domain-containing protein n=1 Tax=Streptomyces kronopolitis TaxID=1612435 RepID=A0ABQ2J9C6_9ACTN|nr:hypothetical protein GCM10012285_23760 [Streptomyces kronopolitis]